MRRLLVVNPNTTAAVSRLLERCAATTDPAVRVRVATARFGAPYIACEASYAIAAHAVLDAWALAEAAEPPDAVLVGCFGDPGLQALREAGVPATGLASAAAIEAAQHGDFAIVTGGLRWEPMLRRLLHGLGLDGALRGILALDANGPQLASDAAGADALARACREAAGRFGARCVVVGGAALAGMAERIQPQVDVPLVDSVAAGLRESARLAMRATPGARDRHAGMAAWLSR